MTGPTNAPRAPAIAQELRETIRGGEYRPGHQLPSARALASRYSAARGTVTAAMAELVREGLVEARPRTGWFVANLMPAQELTRAQLGVEERQRTHQVERVTASHASPEVAVELGVPAGAPVLTVTRTTVDPDGTEHRAAPLVLGSDQTLVYEWPGAGESG